MSAQPSSPKPTRKYTTAAPAALSPAARLEALKQKRSRSRRIKVSVISGLVLALLVGLVLTLRADGLMLRDIQVEGTHVLREEDVAKSVNDLLSQNWLWIIPKRSMPIYPQAAIEAKLRESFPRIEELTVEAENTHTLKVSLEERDSVYLWCEPAGADECYYIDDTGMLFAKAPYFSGNIFFKFKTDLVEKKTTRDASGTAHAGGGDTLIGSRVLLSDTWTKVVQFMHELESLKLPPLEIKWAGEDAGVNTLVMLVGTPSAPAKILFSAASDMKILSGNLAAALATDPLASITKNGVSTVDYFDLRYSKKVYFKLKK